MPVHRVVILGNKAMVVPPVLAVDRNDSVTFEADGADVVITFNDSRTPFGTSSLAVAANTVSPIQTAGQRGVYPYAVWCVGTPGHSATGNSDPIIIIKR